MAIQTAVTLNALNGPTTRYVSFIVYVSTSFLLQKLDLIVQKSLHPDVPLHWLGRARGGSFRFLDDDHLCHLTNVPTITLDIYDPRTIPHWRRFEPNSRVNWPENVPILLKQRGLPEAYCLGIQYFVRELHIRVPGSLPIPQVYRQEDWQFRAIHCVSSVSNAFDSI